MRTTLGIAAAATLAVTALTAAGTATAALPTAPAADPAGPSGLRGLAAEAVDALDRRPGAARETAGQEFVALDAVTDADGGTHVRLDRTVHGVPVVGGDLVVHRTPSGAWEGVSQTLAEPLDLGVTPSITAAEATTAALRPDAETADVARLRAGGEPRLVVDSLGATPTLAWEVTTTGRHPDQTPSRILTYVDAGSGEVLRREEQIHVVDGEGESLYSGTVPLQLTQSGATYQLKDPTRGNTATHDMGNKQDNLICQITRTCSTGTLFTGPDTRFGGGRESAAVDAQYGTDVTWDYYQQVHDRDGIFGDGRGSINRVHYGTDYVNAFWDGEKMTYGDGDGVDFGPLVSLDVAGHEMSHGVTENTADLTYSGESGGLNEATSDIFGTMVEFYADNPEDPADYFIGEEFDLAAGEGFRRMDDPQLDGSSLSCWTPQAKDADVHHSSGIGNHFFYLLAEGSGTATIGGRTHTSPTCDGSTVTGIGRSAAERIWFRALDVYMTSGTDYAGARQATLSAATDLFGAGSAEEAAVAAAWTAVDVG